MPFSERMRFASRDKEADMQKTAVLKVLPVSELKPAEYNPRKKLKAGDKEYEKIKNSI